MWRHGYNTSFYQVAAQMASPATKATVLSTIINRNTSSFPSIQDYFDILQTCAASPPPCESAHSCCSGCKTCYANSLNSIQTSQSHRLHNSHQQWTRMCPILPSNGSGVVHSRTIWTEVPKLPLQSKWSHCQLSPTTAACLKLISHDLVMHTPERTNSIVSGRIEGLPS